MMAPYPQNYVDDRTAPFASSSMTSSHTMLVDVGAVGADSDSDSASAKAARNHHKRSPLGLKRSSPSPILFNASPTLLASVRRRIPSIFLTCALLFAIYHTYQWGASEISLPTIIIITPTHKRPERLADMTRFSQTLMHIKKIHWIVIEDANKTYEPVERLLKRTGLPFSYFYTTTKPGFPRRGWTHRNFGLEYIRKHYKDYKGEAVIYFADDDNSYDIRLFNNYIRNVQNIGIWAVGLAGAAIVEAPHVEYGVITKWDVVYAPGRKFAVDMAGFAVNLKLILSTNASFHEGCTKVSPESCFLQQFGLDKSEVQAFGWNEKPKDILVWHTKTRNIGTKGSNYNYTTET